MRWLIAVFGCASLVYGAASFAAAQTATDPALHRRNDAAELDNSVSSKRRSLPGRSTLPSDAAGEYLLDESGSVVQIILDSGKLTGYVTKMGDEQSDKDTPLTLFFEQTTLDGNHLSFTTKKVHGIWYSFEGTIIRGDPKTPKQENGFYRLTGTWISHDDPHKIQATRTVSLKSTPRLD